MKTAFIFDFDGTIGETIPLVFEAAEAAYASVGLSAPSRAEMRAHFGPCELGFFRSLTPECGDGLFRKYLEFYGLLHDKFSPAPFEGIPETVKLLVQKGAKVGIVTGKSKNTAEISLSKYGIAPLFSPIECGSPKGAIKPEKIAAVLSAWKTTPAETKTYYVGDAVGDVSDAEIAGIIPLSAAWSKLADIAELKKTRARKIFESVSDFRDWADAAF